ncbi:LamG-like jellyroll fold domain-containing protein [Catellatospora tritici]|uniref:LamG-like jellyroll fold domain-containing protein n=1 Tax=Catellatospora tritici TaxID=2851566 RepID=UPI001C2DB7DC|nr:LamG-like jellyroll fold domain-containing protein [Catellatospora tritici]MBV1854612.1 PKD domain-containing protein [Catellatospora tritici]
MTGEVWAFKRPMSRRSAAGLARQTAGSVAAVLLLSGLVVAGSSGPAQAEESCLSAADTAAAASEMAKRCGASVLVSNLVDEYATHIANADGTFTFAASSEPQRVQKAQGWVPIDQSLSIVGGRVVPAATVLDVSLSAGGTGDVVVMRDGAASLSLSWPKPLPVPTLEGNVATYPEVMPGVDLQITVEAQSFSQVLVVKTREAATNPALARVAWGVRAEGVELQTAPSGGLQAVDSSGQVVFVAPPASMWGSPAQPDAAQARALGMSEGESLDETPTSTVGIPTQLSEGQLAVIPDAEMLAAQETTFPVMIDPSFGDGYTRWATVEKTAPDTSYQSGTAWPRDFIRAGRAWGETSVWRSLMTFTISDMAGSTIVGNPSFTIRLDHSGACGDTPVELWQTSYFGSSGVTWNSTTGSWVTNYGSKSGSANDSCSAQNAEYLEWSTSTMKSIMQSNLNGGYSTFNVGLKAPDETDQDQWKRFGVGTATLEATYNKAPNAPVGKAMLAPDCYTAPYCSSPAFTGTKTPTLRADVSDPLTDTLYTKFEVRAAASDTAMLIADNSAGLTTTSVSAGVLKEATWTIPTGKITADGTFYWRAMSADEATLTGPWSAWQTFTVDTAPPTISAVTSSQYPSKTWGAVAGTAGTFTITASGANDYTWSVDGGSVSAPSTSPTVTYTPGADGVHTMRVNAKDKAGNSSGNLDYQFWVSPIDPTVRCLYWNLNETSGTTAADTGKTVCTPTDNTVTAVNGTLSGTAAFGTGHDGNGVSFTGTGGQVTMSGPAVNTSQDFTMTAWVKPSDLSLGDQTVISQDGTNTSRFQLYYDAQANSNAGGWCFGMRATDTNAAIAAPVCATGTIQDDQGLTHQPQNGVWVHLAGVYNSAAGTLQIHVMGNPTSCSGEMVQGSFTGSWTTSGSLIVGRAKAGATGAEYFRGVVDEVRAYPKALTTTKICQLAGQ